MSDPQIRAHLEDYEHRMELGRQAVVKRPSVRTKPAFYVDEASIRQLSVFCRIALGEDPPSLRQLLTEAAENYLIFFRMRNLWTEADRRGRGEKMDISMFTPERMFVAAMDGIILNRADWMREMAAFDPAAYSGFHPPRIGSYHAILRAYFTYTMQDRQQGGDLGRAFLTDPAFANLPEILLAKMHPQMAALAALSQRDERGYGVALQRLVEVHQQHAQEGGGAQNPGTLVCLEGLALVALARRDGIAADIESIHLPTGLIA